jgi:hypothetical protein
LDSGVAQDFVEEGGVLRVPVPDQVRVGGVGVRKVNGRVAGGLAGGAEHADAAGGVFDDGEDVPTLPGQGDGLNEVAGYEGIGSELDPVCPELPFQDGELMEQGEDLRILAAVAHW